MVDGKKLSELDILEQYLKEKRIPHRRIDEDVSKFTSFDRHQIIVYDVAGHRLWDAICQKYSYGYEHGLLEVIGSPVVRAGDEDSVCGYLTAQDVIDRLEGMA